MNKVKPFFRVEIGASEKSADISKIRDKILKGHKISSPPGPEIVKKW